MATTGIMPCGSCEAYNVKDQRDEDDEEMMMTMMTTKNKTTQMMTAWGTGGSKPLQFVLAPLSFFCNWHF